ncbi:TonB-dependent receptor [Novosphingobium sp. KACC 22771]|uniref:TonB-dependent receptor n=1 Tax=Novosphingobium sp. KACC 22771 TaxID=3025670 RepID=UPI0023670776|nr:TonB-dependent receptor [Novosphingobium sp. KACC 22771]WDF73961.1 TonB-dependent receptor [Novosphingobium sp. KACC 22771]
MGQISAAHLRLAASGLAIIVAGMTAGLATGAQAQSTTAAPAKGDEQAIVVTGFRTSLAAALNEKRASAAAIDTIKAEDVGKFPDSNLAESMQRVPGIALARGDGGEGKNISVRGLGPGFTRVRLNGMEGTAQTGSSDIYGAGNTGRSFDFNVFPTEIFSELAVRKTPSADVEEGSLGATVDLKAPHPLDFKKSFVATISAKGVWNEVSKKLDPRVSVLLSKQNEEGTFGVLATASYSHRNIREVGYSAVNILPTYVNGGFCSPLGYAPQNPATNAAKGTDAANCSTGNPRTGSTAAYSLIQSMTGPSGQPGGGVFLPRIPRYLNSRQDAERMGGSLALQWRPDDNTEIAFDALFSRFKVTRWDNYIDALSFARNTSNNGQPMVSVVDLSVKPNGSLLYGLFNGVDLRSESLRDKFTTTFGQANLNIHHKFTDHLTIDIMAGYSRSIFDNPERLTVNLDAIDTPGYAIDFRGGGSIPVIKYGIDVANPANFNYAPGRADGTVLGNFNTRNWKVTTDNYTFEANSTYEFNDAFKIKGGAQYRQSAFKNRVLGVAPANQATTALPAGASVADFTYQITGLNNLLIPGALPSFLATDIDKWKQTVGFNNFTFCGVECGNGSPEVREEEASAFLMGQFNLPDTLPIPIRGDVGVRFVNTSQHTVGYIPTAAAAGAAYPTVAVPAIVDRSYSDWLPSANLVLEFTPHLLGRLSAAKVMSRPELGVLPSGGSVNAVTRTATIGNPYLDPIRASTYDAALEWYFRPGSLLSVAYFHKDISTYIQSVSSLVPYNTLGLPNALLTAAGTQPTDLFTVTRSVNTKGGPLNGVEVNLQLPFTFLRGFARDFGLLANYTHVSSKVNYVLQSSGGVATLSTTANLVNMSPDTASGTLYYENRKFSIRGTINYRGPFIRQIPSGANDSDVLGNSATTFVDASFSYNLMKDIKFTIEGQNLTDEHNVLYIDSGRQDPLFNTRTGRTITVGVNAKF